MAWKTTYQDDFEQDVEKVTITVRKQVRAGVNMVAQFGPSLGRKKVDTVRDSEYSGMKEYRFNADGGVWRMLFKFDDDQTAVFLVAGDKKGKNEKLFYRRLIAEADERYAKYLAGKRGYDG